LTSTALLPACGVRSHVMELADAAVTVHEAVPTDTTLSPGVALNPVPDIVSEPTVSRVDGETLVMVGVEAS